MPGARQWATSSPPDPREASGCRAGRDGGGGTSRRAGKRGAGTGRSELRPEELVRDLVVELHLRGLDEGAEGLGAAFGLGASRTINSDTLELPRRCSRF